MIREKSLRVICFLSHSSLKILESSAIRVITSMFNRDAFGKKPL